MDTVCPGSPASTAFEPVEHELLARLPCERAALCRLLLPRRLDTAGRWSARPQHTRWLGGVRACRSGDDRPSTHRLTRAEGPPGARTCAGRGTGGGLA